MTPIDVVLISGFFTIGGSTLAWWLARRDKREQRKAEAATPGAPTVQEIWVRQDNMERAFKSALELLEEVADQEHVDTSKLSKKHVKVLFEAGYLPEAWEHLVQSDK